MQNTISDDNAPSKLVRMAALSDLREFTLLMQRQMALLITITALVAAASLFLSLALPKQYKASAIVIIDPRKTQITDIESVVTSLSSDNSTVRSEINVLESRTIIDRVINTEGVVEGLNDDLQRREEAPLAAFMAGLSKKEKAQQFKTTTQEDRTRLANYISNDLKVFNDGRSYTITISYSAGSPQLAARIANAFADSYIEEQVSGKYAATERADEWLSGRIDDMRTRVEVAETAVEEFKNKHHLAGLGEDDTTLTQQQLMAISTQLVAARANRAEVLSKLQSTENILREKGNLATASTVLSSPLIQKLQEQEAEVRRREAELGTRYGDRHPSLINVRAELNDIRSKISEEVNKIVQGMRSDAQASEARVASLERELSLLQDTTSQGNQDMVALRQLQREADAQRVLYEGFLERSKQVSEQRDLQISDARVIARAVPPTSSFFPRKSLFGALGVVLGGILSMLVILIMEYFDRGFRSMSEVERIAQVSCIGMVPMLPYKNSHAQAKYILEKPLSSYAEALRTVHTAIHFINAENPAKVVMVTSSVPHEGKTTLALGLTRLMARTGSKVLLIDADLRHPRVHEILELDNKTHHLAAVLQGSCTATEAIQKDESGADLLLARSTTLSPQNLLGSQQMKKLLEELRGKYDLVILDTPPVLAVADVAKVAHMVDASIYAIKWGDTPYDVVMHGLRLIKTFKIKLAGTVLTQVNLKRQSRYGYGDYGHYYSNYSKYYSN